MIEFNIQEKNKWGTLQAGISQELYLFLKSGKSFNVEFKHKKEKKTALQCRTIHGLCKLLATRLTESNGINYSFDCAKTFVKMNNNFIRQANDEECVAEAVNYRISNKLDKKGFEDLILKFKESLKKPRSFADASSKEMSDMTEWVLVLAGKMGWDEICIEQNLI